MNILVLAAGAGRRFREAGYQEPKPLIDLFGQPMSRVRKTKRWKPQGVTIFVYAPILAAYEPIRTPIVGNKLETF